MTHLKILTTAAAIVMSLAATPVFAQGAVFYGPYGEQVYGPQPYYAQGWTQDWTPSYGQSWTPYYGQNWAYDNSGWNGYNNGGFNNTWFDGRSYRSDPRPRGEYIGADATVVVPSGGYGGSYARMDDREDVSMSDETTCEQRYKSFDPASGTYLGFDGRRHACR
jgi:hypothetical protein